MSATATEHRGPGAPSASAYRSGCRCPECRAAAAAVRRRQREAACERDLELELERRAEEIRQTEAHRGEVFTLIAAGADRWRRYLELREARKRLELEIDREEIAFKEAMGPATVLRIGRRTVATFGEVTIAAHYREERTFRRFSVVPTTSTGRRRVFRKRRSQ